jgi:hypothetical protein
MQMTHTNIESLSPAVANAATGTSRQREPFELLRSDDNQALARTCSR